jgi:hypothetical protein
MFFNFRGLKVKAYETSEKNTEYNHFSRFSFLAAGLENHFSLTEDIP